VADAPAFGFNESGETWLPQPAEYRDFARDAQTGVSGSTLELYKRALRIRREFDLGLGSLTWIEGMGENVLAFTNGSVSVFANYSDSPATLPAGEIILDTTPIGETDTSRGMLAPATTVWMRRS